VYVLEIPMVPLAGRALLQTSYHGGKRAAVAEPGCRDLQSNPDP
jgi:hypothetical protein